MRQKAIAWAVCAIAVFLYHSGEQILSYGLGTLFVVLLIIDVRRDWVQISAEDQKEVTKATRLEEFFQSWQPSIILAVIILMVSQLILLLTYTEAPGTVAPPFCFLCSKN